MKQALLFEHCKPLIPGEPITCMMRATDIIYKAQADFTKSKHRHLSIFKKGEMEWMN
jgi:hypothetical protein